MKKLLFIGLSFFLAFVSNAQQDLTLFELRAIPQANQINVSRTPYANSYVQLPVISGLYFTAYNQGFNMSDFTEKTDSGTYAINMERGLERMKDLNDMGFDLRTTLLGFGFRAGANYFTFNIEEKMSTRFTYPKTLFEFLWRGNAAPEYLDQRVSLDGLAIDVMGYTEVSLGLSRDLNEKFSIGARVKYLSGHANYKTTNSKLGVKTTSDAYTVHIDGAFAFQSAGAVGQALDTNSNFEDNLIPAITGNHGGAVDLGLTYRLSNKISFNASVNDVGMIMWRTGVKNGTADSVGVIYEGQDLTSWNQDNISEDGIVGAIDTIVDQFDFVENSDGYNTWLPTKVYVGANYRLLQKTDLSVLSYNEFYNSRMRTSMRVALTQRVRNWLMATVNYSLYGRSAANVGLGFSMNGGPVQFYMVSDNVLSYLLPANNKNFHLRFGINLTFANNFSQN